MTDEARLQFCWALSASLHLAGGAAYLHWHQQSIRMITVINEVDFLEPEPIRPQPGEEPAPPPAPKSIVDLFKLALPKLEKSKALEEAAPTPKTSKLFEPDPTAPIDLKKGLSSAQPALNLEHGPAKSTRRLEDAAPSRSPNSRPAALAEASIPLEEVGLAAVKRPPAPRPQPLSWREGPARSGLIAERLQAPRSRSAAASQLTDAPIALSKTNSAPRPSLEPAPETSASQNSSQLSTVSPAKPGASSIRQKFEIEAPAIRKSSNLSGTNEQKAVEISGPISNRKILKYALPEYPQWARSQGITADVVLEFSVTPDGKVGDKIKVNRTSGHKELDQKAIEALKIWSFEPLPGSENQWGFVTMRYILE